MCDDKLNVTLNEHVVFQSKEAVCKTEVDIASLKDKQYIRKSYQNTMEFTKERQLEADVVEVASADAWGDLPNKRDAGIQEKDCGIQKSKTEGAIQHLARNTGNLARRTVMSEKVVVKSADKNATKTETNRQQVPSVINTGKGEDSDAKFSPEKPPRMAQSSDKSTIEIAVPRSSFGDGRSVGSPPDTPSIMSAGSRLSTFSRRSPSGSVKGHARSKSEIITVDQLSVPSSAKGTAKDNTKGDRQSTVKKGSPKSQVSSKGAIDRSFSDTTPSKRSQLLKSPVKPASTSKPPSRSSSSPSSQTGLRLSSQISKSQSLSSFSSSSSKVRASNSRQSHLAPETSPKSLIKRDNTTTTGRSVGKHNTTKKEVSNSRLSVKPEVKMPVSRDESKGKMRSDGGSSSDNEKLLRDGRISPVPVPSGRYNNMLRELSFHNIMSKPKPPKLADEEASSSPSAGKSVTKKDVPSDKSRGSRHERNLHPPSNLQVPTFRISPSNEIPAPRGTVKPQNQVRKSTFITHEEDHFIMEDKPLQVRRSTSNCHSNLPDDDDSGSVSPGALSADSVFDTHSDRDELACSDNTGGALPLRNKKSEHRKAPRASLELDKHDECDDSADGKEPLNRPMSPNESLRISQVSENLHEFSRNTEKEGFLHRTFLMRDGKKCRKDWKQSYARYIIGQFNSGSSGLLYFSKNKDEDKKAEMFEFHESCLLEHSSDKKTSRQQVLGLRNGRDTEVLLQFDDKDIADEWFKVLVKHEGMHFDNSSVQEKSKKGSGKVRREPSNDNLNQDNQGITLKLLSFIKKRPLKETLEKKGIYKEAVFGSTLAELASQDKMVTPIFVLQCIKNIESTEENLRTDGLYRISGNAAHIQKIRYEIAQRNYAILSKEKDVHNLSGSLKLFFRELKEPLIPYANYDDFIQATGAEFRRVNQQIEKLSKAVRRLPAENLETLKVLLTHLLRVTEFESDNRMSVSNLAIVFGPCLLWPKDTTSNDLMTDVMLHNRIIEGLLSDFTKIFPSKR